MGEQQQLGRYELEAEIGRGATGVVYKARDPLIDRVVAIKTVDFRSFGANQAVEQSRFFQEAKSAGRLSHPNIVTIYDAGEAQGCAYIAMELLEGASLREMLDGRPPLSVGRALEITAQVARGLAYAHEHGVVHRDVKPANVILVGSRRAKITDFGIARANTASHTAQDELAGSPKYMSPEQVRGDVIDGRSDLFSLGAMLYEMTTGKQPFNGPNLAAIMKAVVEEAPRQPSTLNAEVPRDVDKLIARMLAKSPDDRYPSARALLRDLTVLMKKYSSKSTADTRDDTLQRAKRIKEARRRRVSDGETTIVMDPVREAKSKRARRTLPMAAFYGMGAVGLAVLMLIALNFRQNTPVANAAPAMELTTPVSTAAQGTGSQAGSEISNPSSADAVSTDMGSQAEPLPQAQATLPAADPGAILASKGTEKATTAVKPPRKPVAAANVATSATAVAPVESATLIVAVSPWGEILIDGESRGTAPPLTSIAVPPGKHRIEIRNGNLPTYAMEMTLGAGETRRIKHKFE